VTLLGEILLTDITWTRYLETGLALRKIILVSGYATAKQVNGDWGM
jgi:hypothetical protein